MTAAARSEKTGAVLPARATETGSEAVCVSALLRVSRPTTANDCFLPAGRGGGLDRHRTQSTAKR